MWTDRQVKGAKPKDRRYRISKPIGVRIPGSLVLDVHTSGAKDFYYQYYGDYTNKKGKLVHDRILLKIGPYKKTPSSFGWTLEAASEKSREYAELLRQGIDPKQHAGEQEIFKREDAKIQGTLEQLLESYLSAMKANGKRSVYFVNQSLQTYVIDPFPQLVNRRANTIEADDIVDILRRMIDNGITTHSNRVRSYLSAAFNHGLKQEHNPRHYTEEGVKFNLKYNPVSSVPAQDDFERVGDHVISEEEIKTIWDELENESLIVSLLVKLALATGQRAGELNRIKWVDVDFEEETMTIPSTVSKNKMDHVVPLCNIAMSVINSLHKLTGECEHLFTGNHKGKLLNGKIMYNSTASRIIGEFCKQKKINKFIARDIRRTFKTLAGKAGISKELRDRLQNHALKDVSTKHYDRYDYLTEKQQGMKVWNDFLELIIYPDKKVTRLVTRLERKKA